jgi:hypothetical protein
MSLICNITAPSTFAACAAFTVPHGWGGMPSELPDLIPTSLGIISYQAAKQFDATYLYLRASGPGVTAVAKVPSASSVSTPGVYQKIVYPSGGGATLSFVYPARNLSAYIPDEIRDDDYSSYGDHQAVVERIDHFIEFDMPLIVAGTDLTNWTAFLDWAGLGGNFDFYPNSTGSGYTTCHLVSKGNKITYKSPGYYKLGTLRLREVIS